MFKSKKKFVIGFLLARVIGLPLIAHAEETVVDQKQSVPEETWNAKFQATYLWQGKPSFHAPYTGTNSLLPNREHAYSATATAFLGLRPWHGTELYYNPEVIQAIPFSNLKGLGG